MAANQLTPEIVKQLNNTPGFPREEEFTLGDWLDDVNLRPSAVDVAALPAADNEFADVRFVDSELNFRAWNGAAWVVVGGSGGPAGSQVVEAPGAALSKLGGPGATDEVIGSVNTPAINLTTDTQLLSGRIIGVPNWDSTQDVTVSIILALDGLQADSDTFDLDFRYIYAESGVAATADLNKPFTALTPQLTVTTAEGLIDETIYSLSFPLDRNDANNGYFGAATGGFAFELNIDVGSSIGSIYLLAAAIEYPVTS